MLRELGLGPGVSVSPSNPALYFDTGKALCDSCGPMIRR
jgi:hypothetical protein